jgi:hypothetical protein
MALRVVNIVAPWKSIRDLNAIVAGMAVLNRYYIDEWKLGPLPLDRSRVTYVREPEGREDWLTLPVLYELGEGDCEDLSAAYAASYGGSPLIYRVGPGQLHAVVKKDGNIIDPSAMLGMRG